MKKFYQNNMHRFFVDIDRYLALIGAPFAICLGLFIEIILHKTIFSVPLFLAGMACLMYLVLRPSFSGINLQSENSKVNRFFILTQSLIILSFAVCIIILYFISEIHTRNISFFFLVSFLSVLLYWSIIYKKTGKYSTIALLVQIIILGIILTWSQIFNFQSIIGEDPYYHAWFVENIKLFGTIPPDTEYSFFPIFHLIIEQFSLISGTTYKLSATLSIGLFQIIINTLFIFLIGSKAINEKIGLFGALLLILSPRHIRMGYEIVPTTLAAIYIPIIVYLVFSDKVNNKSALSVLIILFTLIMILTHSLTSVWLIVVFMTLVLSFIAFSKLNVDTSTLPLSIKICIMSIIGVLGWWSFASGHIHILGGYIKSRFDKTVLLREVDESVWLTSSNVELVVNNLGMYLFISLSIIGCFYMVSRWGNKYSYYFAWTGMTTALITIMGPLLQKFIIVGRWQYFSFILLAIPLALSIVLLHKYLKNRPIFSASSISCLIFILAFIMISSPIANNDNPFFSPTTHIRYGHSDSEILAIVTFTRIGDGDLYTDTYFSVLGEGFEENIKSADRMIYDMDFKSVGEKPILIREEIVSRPVDMFRNAFWLKYNPRVMLNNQGYSQTFNNGGVFAYQFV